MAKVFGRIAARNRIEAAAVMEGTPHSIVIPTGHFVELLYQEWPVFAVIRCDRLPITCEHCTQTSGLRITEDDLVLCDFCKRLHDNRHAFM